MSYEIEVTVSKKIRLTAEQVAGCFWELDDSEMCEFLNILGEKQFSDVVMQLAYVCKNAKLTPAGRRIMELFGEYSKP